MSGLGWLAVGLAAAWAVAGVAIAVVIGRSIRIADDHDVWGCDVCEQQAVEQAMSRHPAGRFAKGGYVGPTCPDYVPEEWS